MPRCVLSAQHHNMTALCAVGWGAWFYSKRSHFLATPSTA
jgi:hypothetical protein